MEEYAASLNERLDPERQKELWMLIQQSVNELYNQNLISQADAIGFEGLHDPDPEVRLTNKTKLAKAVACNFITTAGPIPLPDQSMQFMAQVKLHPGMLHSIALCLQGGIEGLVQTGLTTQFRMKYSVVVDPANANIEEFRNLISLLNRFYEDIDIVLEEKPGTDRNQNSTPDEKTQEKSAGKPEEKTEETLRQLSAPAEEKQSSKKGIKGFFSSLFKR